ncbi:Outer membrane protein beta-barrel domain-containing protein [Reichenbachiella faecimaris]|uniref:Outer membrane protein beta-barrel domain-containing protein n=1 Tax=Reichenbachiella faecimaris TaxID=692418 RepID=A0A1W2GKG0_REIFA|nr:porin family protein [Reichenbachiella faecimaris]SMD37044.1 Outer membrane protein beta-barrel domain-containing protein [Reichenbachiella faecimaris]
MKKITLLLVIGALFMTTASQAQLTVGLKGGLNFNSADVDGLATDVDNKTGYHFGAYAVIKAGPIGIQPEAYFSVQSVSTDADDYDLSYIQVPILLRLGLLKVLYLNAGPQFGINTKAKYGDVDLKDDIKGLDTSIALGAGLDLPLGLGAQLRWTKSLSSIAEDGDTDWKNSMVQLSVTYALIGKN